MKFLYPFLFFLTLNAFADGGCLLEPMLNKVIEEKLAIKCESFPEVLDKVDYFAVKGSGTFTFYEKDFNRMSRVNSLVVQGTEAGLKIAVVGMVGNQWLNFFSLDENITTIDTSQGDFQFKRGMNFQIPFRKDFFKHLWEANSISFVAKPDEVMDFGDIYLSNVRIRGGKEVRNISFSGYDLNIEGNEDTPLRLVNIGFSVSDLHLNNVVIESVQSFPAVNGSMELTNAIFKTGFIFEGRARLRTLKMTNSRMQVDPYVSDGRTFPVEIFKTLEEVELLNSEISGTPLPSFSGLIKTFEVYNSSILLDKMPEFPEAELIGLTGKTIIKNPELPFRIHEKLKYANFSDNHLKKLNLEFVNPRNLLQIYVMGNPELEVSVSNPDKASVLPPYFVMIVDKESQAREFRRLFKRRSVAFLDWLPLKKD
jgi:hypothetical protein